MTRSRRIATAGALAGLLAAAEATALRATDFRSALALAPQVAAPGAIGAFHDLRWALIYHNSWWSLALILVLGAALRTLVTAMASWAAWPDDLPNPGWWTITARSGAFNLGCLPMLLPWAIIAVAASETALSWFVLGELAPFTIIVLASAAGPFRLDWWRRTPRASSVGWTAAMLLWATVSGAVVSLTPKWWAVPVSGLLGAGFVASWLPLTRGALSPSRWSRVPTAGIAVALAILALVASGPIASFSDQRAAGSGQAGGISADDTELTIVFVNGYNSSYDASETPPDRVRIFSYAGLDGAQNPLPYDPIETHRSIDSSARMLADQVSAAAELTGRRVAIVAQSEGALVLRRYLDTLPHPDVVDAVMLSPLVSAGRSYYPAPSATSGWGLASGWTLRGLLWLVRAIGHDEINADEPFVRSVLDDAPFYRNRMLCPVAGVRLVAFLPTDSAVVVPAELMPGVPVVVVDGLHGQLLGRPDVNEAVHAFLRGDAVGSPTAPAAYGIIQRSAAAWQAPALALPLNSAWAPSRWGDAAFGGVRCNP